ncbi:MAG: DUF2157 domain-containing protein [Pseudomonadota bacterium]
MHDLSVELRELVRGAPDDAGHPRALRIEARELLSVRRELLVLLYVAVATLVAGVGLLVKANYQRIGPVALLTSIFAAAALCYALAWRVKQAGRERSLGIDYVLLLGALLFSAAVGYAEVQFHVFGAGWSRHLLWLASWHLAAAYWFRSRLVLSVALTAFAGWLGVEASLGRLFEPRAALLGTGPRALSCALLFWLGSRLHLREQAADGGFREVYRQFAANFGFWGALALGGASNTRWIGAIILVALAFIVGRAGLVERRQSFVLYAVAYTTIGLVWLESLVMRDYLLASWIGLFTVIGAVVLLMRLRARLQESTT